MNEKWNFKATLYASHGQVTLLHMAECFGINNPDTIFSIAMKSADENTKKKLETCYNGIGSAIERDVSVLKEKGFAYYVNEHAKPYINAAYTKEKTAKALQHLQIMVEWQEFDEVKAVLRDMFTAMCFNTIFIDKKQFVIAAIEDEGREPVKNSEVLTEEYIKKIRSEMAQKKQNNALDEDVFSILLSAISDIKKYNPKKDFSTLERRAKDYLYRLDPNKAEIYGILKSDAPNRKEDYNRFFKNDVPKLKKHIPNFPDLPRC